MWLSYKSSTLHSIALNKLIGRFSPSRNLQLSAWRLCQYEEETVANSSGIRTETGHQLETRASVKDRGVAERAFHTPVGSFDRTVVHPYCVRIFNVPKDLQEEKLVKVMGEFGELQQFSLSEEHNANGVLRCFATVGFTRIEAADKALSMDGKLFEGRTLRICRLRMNPPKSDLLGGRTSS
ncbi:uncharacterized protein Gasu_51500 [Galdieria sulphuraria]|uniref:RRM domain-containing protein n=1 Tax=Galdieria sulphuraria TaxID=130081 RepID=M2WTQ6_GALSU|nr:uncharacterized protein Gasu_51500 [Galdieria sulphuraria]EME27295.1 hypothetical protein Gasu_51500 [Galdieria sulphuraria]|eukprot:XP_005703815.1 hypothetical protein Gasu_51500 [Galdieria sulphuraria]